MRVLYICNAGDWSGSTIALKNILSQPILRGGEIVVVCKCSGEFTQWLEEQGIAVEILNFDWYTQPSLSTWRSRIAFLRRLLRLLNNTRRDTQKLIEIIRQFKPDIIHSNNGIIEIGRRAARELGVPHIWHLREYQRLDFGMRPIPSMSAFRKRVATTHSICITHQIQSYFKAPTAKSRVIYDGVMPRDSIRHTPQKEDYFLYVGRLDTPKGIASLIDAFIRFSQENKHTELWVAGKGTPQFEAAIQEKVAKAALGARIQFLGYREDRYELMYHAKALIVPSRCEGFGFITIEAIFNGCPVIGYNNGGTVEIAQNTPEMVHLYNCQEELVKLLKKETLYDSNQIDVIQQKAQELYSVEQAAAQVYEFYQELINHNIQ